MKAFKFLSILIAVVMIFSAVMPVLADGPPKPPKFVPGEVNVSVSADTGKSEQVTLTYDVWGEASSGGGKKVDGSFLFSDSYLWGKNGLIKIIPIKFTYLPKGAEFSFKIAITENLSAGKYGVDILGVLATWVKKCGWELVFVDKDYDFLYFTVVAPWAYTSWAKIDLHYQDPSVVEHLNYLGFVAPWNYEGTVSEGGALFGEYPGSDQISGLPGRSFYIANGVPFIIRLWDEQESYSEILGSGIYWGDGPFSLEVWPESDNVGNGPLNWWGKASTEKMIAGFGGVEPTEDQVALAMLTLAAEMAK